MTFIEWVKNNLPLFTYLIMVMGWYCFALVSMADGYWHELTGGKSHEYHRHTHRLMWQWHTGLHIDPKRSHGDERRLKRTAVPTTRSTPEGQMVYWTRLPRWAKAIRNNVIVLLSFAFLNGLIWYAQYTIVAFCVAAVVAVAFLAFGGVRKARRHVAQRQPVQARDKDAENLTPFARARARKLGVAVPAPYVAGGVIVEEKPSLTGGVPQKVLSGLLAAPVGVSTDEAATLLTLTTDKGTLRLPDRFPALGSQRDTIEEIIRAQTTAEALKFTWHTSSVPRSLEWTPVINRLPASAVFREWLAQIEKLPVGDLGVGLTMERNMYVTSHNGDTPWWLRSAGSGTGKSTGFLVKSAQILHQDPTAELYCWDSKQISFLPLHGHPRVHIYDDPVTNLGGMWNGFYDLAKIMRERYTAVRTGQARKGDFPNIWVLVDEGNDLGGQFKTLWDSEIKPKGGSAAPAVWPECVVPIIYQGREVGIRGEWMFQNMTDKALGGVSLRDAFPGVGMAGYKKNQWTRIIGSKFVEPRVGPGKICMCLGTEEDWVQGFYDDIDYLRDYAGVGREGKAA